MSSFLLTVVLAAAASEASYDYDVSVAEGGRELAIEARYETAGPGCFEVGEGAEPYVAAAEVKDGRRWRPDRAHQSLLRCSRR